MEKTKTNVPQLRLYVHIAILQLKNKQRKQKRTFPNLDYKYIQQYCNLKTNRESKNERFLAQIICTCSNTVTFCKHMYMYNCLFVLLDHSISTNRCFLTTKVVSSNPVHGEVYSTQQYVIKLLSDLRQVGRTFSPSTPVSSTNKTDRHDIAEILLKVSLSTINQTQYINI